jgi:DNA-binding SARP family transcriptional activator
MPRKRLFSRLGEATRSRIVWIVGPAGSGKTTLAGTFIESRDLPCLWYQVDSGDEDPASFFYYLSIAGRAAAPRWKKPLPLLTPEHLPSFAAFSRDFFEDLGRRLPASTHLVFDNCQEVSERTLLHAALLEGLSRLRPDTRLILLSREAPPAAYARLVAHGEMATLGWEDLKFTLDETEGIARQRGFDGPAAEAVRTLYGKTDGWAAGIRVFLEALRTEGGGLRLGDGRTPQEIFDYLGQEVFDRLEATAQDFLLRSSFLADMTAAMTQAITGNADSGRILDSLSRRNLFTVRRPGQVTVYQYHPLFREFLQERATAILPGDESRSIRTRAAAMFKAAGEPEQAVLLLREAGEWDELASLILEVAPSLYSQGRMQMLEGWLAALPMGRMHTVPWLSFWRGKCRLPIDPAEARQYFERAYRRFLEMSDSAGAYWAWASAIETFFPEFDELAPLDGWIDELASLQARWPEIPAKELEGPVIHAMICALLHRRPHDPRIARWAGRAEEICLRHGDPNPRLLVGGHLMMLHLWLGDHSKARWLRAELESCAKEERVAPINRIGWHVSEGLCAWFHDDIALCRRSVEEGVELSRKTGVHVLDGMLFAQLVYGSLSGGDLSTGAAFLKKMASAMDSRKTTQVCMHQGLAAWLAFLQGDLRRAIRHAQTALEMARKAGGPFAESINSLLLGQLLAEAGKKGHAAELLIGAESAVQAMDSRHLLFLARLAQSRLAFLCGDRPLGLAILGKALTLGRENAYFVVPWSKPEILSQLCAEALGAGIETGYVKQLIKRRNLKPDADSQAGEAWPRPIKVYTLGRFGIVKDEESLAFTGKVQQRPLSMLKAVIAFGGRNVTEEQIVDALWPGADGDTAHLSVATTLHRLRRLLGSEDALRLRDGRLSLDRQCCWVDAWGFQRIAGEAIDLWRKEHGGDPDAATDGRAEEAIGLTEKAVGLYRGDFMPGDSSPWALPMRERLKSKFVRLLSWLGEHYERSRQWDKAAECCHRALEEDALQEEFHRRLMWCHHAAGRRAEALATYERCRDLLSSTFGVEPARRTVETAKAIREQK